MPGCGRGTCDGMSLLSWLQHQRDGTILDVRALVPKLLSQLYILLQVLMHKAVMRHMIMHCVKRTVLPDSH